MIDFGLARFLKKGDWAFTWCGTLGYTSPEVVLKLGYDYSVDVWGIGIILCEMLGGFSPFYNEDPQKMFDNTIHCWIHWPTGLNHVAKHLISQILVIDPVLWPSIDEIKQHMFFHTFNWSKCAKG